MGQAVDLNRSVLTARLFDFYGGLLSERQREIISLHYEEDLSLSEISEICGITRQGVQDAMKKAENALMLYEEKLGLMSRADELASKLETLADRLEKASGEEERSECIRLIRELQL